MPAARPIPCPCGVGRYDQCCGPLIQGAGRAETAEQLMRSRYTAYVLGKVDHLWRTWHPRTRPPSIHPDPTITWTGLVITEVVDGGHDDDEGVVAFRASFTAAGQPDTLVERSQFERRGQRWTYVGGIDPADPPAG